LFPINCFFLVLQQLRCKHKAIIILRTKSLASIATASFSFGDGKGGGKRKDTVESEILAPKTIAFIISFKLK